MSGIEPKYVQVQQHLIERIRSGDLRPGDRLPTEANLCQQLKVSRITVRRAITDLARQGYLKSRGGYGHVVNAVEPQPTIGVLMNQPMFGRMQQRPISQFALLLMNALRLELRERAFHCRLYLPQPHNTEHQLDHGALHDDLDRGLLAGLITSGWPHEAHRHTAKVLFSDVQLHECVQRRGVPLVSVTSRDVNQASTSSDYFAVGHRGAEYFLQQGIESIALLTIRRPSNPTREGFEQALADWGLRPREAWIFEVEHHEERTGYEAFAQWWAGLENHPQALVIDDDHTGRGAMLAATYMGLGSDAQLRIACQSVRGSEMLWPRPCIKLQFDPAAFARDAVDKIAYMLAHPGAEPERTWIRPSVVEDQSDVAPPLCPADTTWTTARGRGDSSAARATHSTTDSKKNT